MLVFSLPLRATDQEPQIDLNALLQDIYDQGGFDLAIADEQPLATQLSTADLAWQNDQLMTQGLR